MQLGTTSLTLEDVIAVARHGRAVTPLQTGTAAHDRVLNSRHWVEQVLARNDRAYYGINTGFGIKAGRVPLATADMPWLSRNLIVSHASGVGPAFHPEVVRAAMLLRAHSLAQGYSGVRPELINTLVQMLNAGVTPLVPELGSVGSSGDLAPLSHLAQVISERPYTDPTDRAHALPPNLAADYDESGRALVLLHPHETNEYLNQALRPQAILEIDGLRYAQLSGAEAMQWRGIKRLVLGAKEGLGLNNGATFGTAVGLLALADAENLVRHAEIGAAMTLESVLGFRDAFLPHVQAVRGHPGQIETAARVLRFLEESTLADGDLHQDPRTLPPQDAYAIRTVPQTIGAIWETLAFVRQTLTREINAATDNPLIFDLPEGDPLHLPRAYKTISGGNFHGTPIGYALDFLSIVITDLASMSERRIYRLVSQPESYGLPGMLIEEEAFGQTSGMMIPQYVASALVSACKTLAHPDSVDSIPTSAGREDFVSMSMNAALHGRQIVAHATHVIAIELLCAHLALDWRQKNLARLLDTTPLDQYRNTPLAHRTRTDEAVLRLHETNQRPRAGRGTAVALAAIRAALVGLPTLGDAPAVVDRFTQPYIGRVHDLVRQQSLVKAVYSAVDLDPS